MNETPLKLRPLLGAIAFLVLGGWGGLTLVILYTQPYAGWRWLFFVFWVMALSGSALPLLYLFHRLFPSAGMSYAILGRQATWVGVYGAILAWLQLGRLVTLPLALELAGLFLALELLLRWREQARWVPPVAPSSAAESPPSTAEDDSREVPAE